MATLGIIVVSGLAMAAIALIGGLTAIAGAARLRRWTLPLVAFASGSLIGAAFLHLLPAAVARMDAGLDPYVWLVAGIAAFLLFEQLLHWQHTHRAGGGGYRPFSVLILVGDGLHNLAGGLAIGAVFTEDVTLGAVAWLAAALHEIPQELGDFGVLVHAGMRPRRALAFNFVSALAFPAGAVAAWALARTLDVAPLVAFAAGTFVYIGGVDLMPEFKSEARRRSGFAFSALWLAGLLLVALPGIVLPAGGG